MNTRPLIIGLVLLASGPVRGADGRQVRCGVHDYFGDAALFNLFAYEDVRHHESDTEGRVAIGGGARGTTASFLVDYRIGGGLTGENRVSLLLGGPLTMSRGTIEPGNVVYGRQAPDLDESVGLSGGLYRAPLAAGTGPWFDATLAALTRQSQGLAARVPTAAIDEASPSLSLAGAGAGAAPAGELVFAIGRGVLADGNAVHELRLDAPAGTPVIINVGGARVTLADFGFVLTGGVEAKDVLFNFPEAETVHLSGIGLQGSVLAPAANLVFVNGVVHGGVYVRSFHGEGLGFNDGQIAHVFAGCDDDKAELGLLRTLGWN